MAFHPITNELYANMNGLSQNYDYLFKINTSNGAMTLVRQINQTSDIEGMAFDAKGDLYVATGSNATDNSDDNKLWKVNIYTGEVSELYDLGGSDVETCDCIIGDPISAVEISGTVFHDKNKNSTYDVNDIETSGVSITLYDDVNSNGAYNSGTDTILETTTTLANGFYSYNRIYGSGTERYLVIIDTISLPSGSTLYTSDILPVTVTQGGVILPDNDFGYQSDIINVIEGYTYGDIDTDQQYDGWESPVSGVLVRLYNDDNCNGAFNSGDAQIDSTIVGADGHYSFLQPYTSGGSSECYITKVDSTSLPTNSSLTTDNIETASFSSGGNTNLNNNFGMTGGAITALPVDWVNFEATKTSNDIRFKWITGAEENCSHFEVQRSIAGYNWERLVQLKGKGHSISITTYNYIDSQPLPGTNYYRIKQVDFDGEHDFSTTIGINYSTQIMINELKLFPNPTQQNVSVSWKSRMLTGFVQLLDLNGQIAKSLEVQNTTNTRMDVSDIQNGVYYIKVSSDEFETVKPLIIIR
jgi:hypothetical protein